MTYQWVDIEKTVIQYTPEKHVRVFIPIKEEFVNHPEYQAYLAWVSEGNEPLPPDPIPEPTPLTPQQKLEAAGLSIEELKGLLGL